MLRGRGRGRAVAAGITRASAIVLASALVVGLGGPPGEAATAPLKTGRPLGSVFHIAKSQNKNQVHYGVKVDAQCRPLGNSPVYGYWRDYEEGPKVTSPLLSHELPAYGLTRPRFIKRTETGGSVGIGLRGFPDRAITIETFRTAQGRCLAHALTRIKKQQAVLRSIYVELGFLFSVDYVVVRGVALPDGHPLQEKVDD
jgi:hypothetical protein